MSDAVITRLKNLHADNFVAYFKAHTYHFVTQGRMFSQDHALLNEIYGFLWDMHDTLGEQVRQLDCTPYTSLKEMCSESVIKEPDGVGDISAEEMFEIVSSDMFKLMKTAQTLYDNSSAYGGCQTLIGDYMKSLSKLHWKVKATLGRSIK